MGHTEPHFLKTLSPRRFFFKVPTLSVSAGLDPALGRLRHLTAHVPTRATGQSK